MPPANYEYQVRFETKFCKVVLNFFGKRVNSPVFPRQKAHCKISTYSLQAKLQVTDNNLKTKTAPGYSSRKLSLFSIIFPQRRRRYSPAAVLNSPKPTMTPSIEKGTPPVAGKLAGDSAGVAARADVCKKARPLSDCIGRASWGKMV